MNIPTDASETISEERLSEIRHRMNGNTSYPDTYALAAEDRRLLFAALSRRSSQDAGGKEVHKSGPVHVDENGNIHRATRDLLFAPLSISTPTASQDAPAQGEEFTSDELMKGLVLAITGLAIHGLNTVWVQRAINVLNGEHPALLQRQPSEKCETCKERPGLVRVGGNPMLGSWDVCPDCDTCHECNGTGKRPSEVTK
jgi:hypothetical protein